MAKLILTETYEGTNEQIEQLSEKIRGTVKSAENRSFYGERLVRVESKVDFDKVDTPLQKQLRSELEQLRSILPASLVAKAESIIERAAEFNSVTGLITSLINGDLGEEEQESYFDEDELDSEAYDDEDDDDCYDDEDYEDDEDEEEEEESFEEVLIKIILG